MKNLNSDSSLTLRNQRFRSKISVLVFSILTIVLLRQVSAEPVMRPAELPLEGTSIEEFKVGNSGNGLAVVTCHRCDNNKIRLEITPKSVLEINGEIYTLSSYVPSNQDFVTVFFDPDSLKLTKLKVVR